MTSATISILFLFIYTVALVAVGVWNRKSESSEAYFLASRSLPPWLLAITFIASWWGGGTAVDLVDHAHRDGLSAFGYTVCLSSWPQGSCIFSQKE